MLYQLKLPLLTEHYLTGLVYIQYDLISYATRSTHVRASQLERSLLLEECTADIKKHSKHNKRYAQQIATEFFQAGKLDKGRSQHLRTFALAYHQDRHTSATAKRLWLQTILNEITFLFPKSATPFITLQPFRAKAASTSPADQQSYAWQHAAREFFLYFYNNFLGKHDSHIPTGFLVPPKNPTLATTFGRRDLVESFHDENHELEICTICDESRFYTRYISHEPATATRTTSEAQLRAHTILDHYLPKSLHPHLCCHPYNLIPVCYACNSTVKGERSPLNTQRQRLHTTALPYRILNLSQQAILHIDLHSQQQDSALATVSDLSIRPEQHDPAMVEALAIFREIYRLPDRWNEKRQVSTILHALFRRIRHFLADSKPSPLIEDIDHEIYSRLKQLLYYLDTENQRHDPYAFAMTWMLIAFLQEYPNRETSLVWQAFVQEICTCFEHNIKESEKRERHVEHLLQHQVYHRPETTQDNVAHTEQLLPISAHPSSKRATNTPM